MTRRRLPLFALLGANAISSAGNMMTLIAVPWFVLQTTGSPALTGLAGFFTALPTVIAGVFGGTLIDRLGFKRTSVAADLASGVTVALIPVLHFTIGLEVWQLLALVFLGALLDAPGMTARYSLLPDLGEAAGQRIERVTGAAQAVARGTHLAAGPLAGVLIALWGPANVLLVDALTFAASALIVWLAVPAPPRRERDPSEQAEGYWRELWSGWRFIGRDPLILSIVVTVMVMNFLDAPTLAVVLPVYANQVFGSAVDLGIMVGAFGGASLLGAIAYGAVGHRFRRRPLFIWCVAALAAAYLGLALLPGFLIATVIYGSRGIAAAPLNPILQAIEYERVPVQMRGRVFGSITAGAWVSIPLGTIAGGYAVEWLGLAPTLLLMGALYVLTTLAWIVNPSVRLMDAPAAPEERTSATA